FEYLHFGAGKVWYATSASDYEKVVSAFRTLYPEEYVYCTNAHVHKEFFVHPTLLEEKFGVKVFKTVQRAGEVIVSRPYTFFSGFCLGKNVSESNKWGNEKHWLDTVGKEVRTSRFACDCSRRNGVILNFRHLDVVSKLAHLEKKNLEMERMIDNLSRRLELVGLSNEEGSSSGYLKRGADMAANGAMGQIEN
ncbi:jumonji family transcription factor, partial [Aphelenchoides avenae]